MEKFGLRGAHEEGHILEKEIDFAALFPPKQIEASRLCDFNPDPDSHFCQEFPENCYYINNVMFNYCTLYMTIGTLSEIQTKEWAKLKVGRPDSSNTYESLCNTSLCTFIPEQYQPSFKVRFRHLPLCCPKGWMLSGDFSMCVNTEEVLKKRRIVECALYGNPFLPLCVNIPEKLLRRPAYGFSFQPSVCCVASAALNVRKCVMGVCLEKQRLSDTYVGGRQYCVWKCRSF